MQTAQRRPVSDVIARLEAMPHRFQFVQAVRLLLIWLRRAGVPPKQAMAEVLRFQNNLSLAFPPSEIAALHIDRKGLEAGPAAKIRITPAFIGLLGMTGTLPPDYTERVATAEHASKDESLRAWFDLFSSRAVDLFFQAWGKYRIEHLFDIGGEDRFRPLLLSLGARHAGKPSASAEGDGDLQADVMAFYLGLLRQRPVSAAALRCILPDYFGVPVAIDQFVGGWDDIDAGRQCRMGGPNSTLGTGGALGVRTWRHDRCVVLRIGPLGKADFARFLPGTPGARAMASLLEMVGVPGLQFVAHVTLAPSDVPRLSLVGGAQPGVRIGWDACLGGTRDTRAAEVRYLLRTS